MDVLHLKSPKNWINDPNGFVYFNGQYHMFYQYFPYEPVWGTMHWGHAVSDDMVHWEHKDIAIYPSKGYDRNGVFSGNALIKDGKLYLYYTGIQYPNPNLENIHVDANYGLIASQCLMISEDGETFDNYAGKQCLITPSKDEEKMSSVDTRDPKVFKIDDKFFMILGSSHNGKGRIIFLESDDAIHFSQKAEFESDEFGGVFECPDLFNIEDKQVVFCAATDYLKDGLEYSAQEIYKFVKFVPADYSFTWEKESFFLDYGMDLYATQTNFDAEGERVLFAWMRMPVPKMRIDGRRWNGLFTLPRQIYVKNNHLYFKPHKYVEKIFEGSSIIQLPNGIEICGAKYYSVYALHNNYKLSIELKNHTQISIFGYKITYDDGIVTADRSKVYPKGNYRYTNSMPKLCDGEHLDIYVDEDVIEIYANDGEYVLSNVVYLDL